MIPADRVTDLWREKLQIRGFSDDGVVLHGPVSWTHSERGRVTARVEVNPVGYPFLPPACRLIDAGAPLDVTFHLDRSTETCGTGAMCLWDDDHPVDEAPWLDPDTYLARVSNWLSSTAAGWPEDTSVDLERYLSPDGGPLVVYDADELAELVDVAVRTEDLVAPVSVRVTNDVRRNPSPSTPRRRHRKDQRLVWIADVGEINTPIRTWVELIGRLGSHADRVQEHVRTGVVERLRLFLGRSYPHECERAALLMEGAGLRSDQQGLDLGMAVAREWVTTGRRIIHPDDVRRAIHERELQIDPQRAVLLVQALDRDAHPEDADEQLDWVDLFAGDSPMSRRTPVDPGDWQRMQQELQAAVGRLEAAGHRALLLRGTMRQATFFLVGTAAPRTREWSLRYSQRRTNSTAATPWDTAVARTTMEPPNEVVHDLRAGDDLVVAVCATTDGSREIIRYVRDASIPARRVLVLTPAGDAHDESLPSSGHAVSFAQQVVQSIREHLHDVPADGLIHLFLIGPGGFAMILGNRWNAVRRTIVYEHLGVGLGYQPAFDVR